MANNKKDPKETIETTATENTNNENNNNESQEETVMNENVNAQAQENAQAEATQTQQAAPAKEKKHMPTWLKYTIAGVIGLGAGIGGTLAVQHFTGDSAEEFNSNMFD
jgi:chemotaxis response regulator CheB